MKKIPITILLSCFLQINMYLNGAPSKKSKIFYKDGSISIEGKKRQRIFVNTGNNTDSFHFNKITTCLMGVLTVENERRIIEKSNADSAVLFVGTKSGLLSRLVYMEGSVKMKCGSILPRYFKDDIAENVGGEITKIKSDSPETVEVHYKKNWKSYKATYTFYINEWQKI